MPCHIFYCSPLGFTRCFIDLFFNLLNSANRPRPLPVAPQVSLQLCIAASDVCGRELAESVQGALAEREQQREVKKTCSWLQRYPIPIPCTILNIKFIGYIQSNRIEIQDIGLNQSQLTICQSRSCIFKISHGNRIRKLNYRIGSRMGVVSKMFKYLELRLVYTNMHPKFKASRLFNN